jgi:hypothetical protein
MFGFCGSGCFGVCRCRGCCFLACRRPFFGCVACAACCSHGRGCFSGHGVGCGVFRFSVVCRFGAGLSPCFWPWLVCLRVPVWVCRFGPAVARCRVMGCCWWRWCLVFGLALGSRTGFFALKLLALLLLLFISSAIIKPWLRVCYLLPSSFMAGSGTLKKEKPFRGLSKPRQILIIILGVPNGCHQIVFV